MARKTNSGTEFKPNRNLNCGRTKSLRNRKLTENDGLKNSGFEKLTRVCLTERFVPLKSVFFKNTFSGFER